MIDFHLFPSFIVTEESAYALLNSPSIAWFTTDIDIWHDEILRQYGVLLDAMSLVVNAQVIDREIPVVGVSIVTYSNGVTLGINYLSTTFDYEGMALAPMQVTVIGGDV
jgi:hypothetical protein